MLRASREKVTEPAAWGGGRLLGGMYFRHRKAFETKRGLEEISLQEKRSQPLDVKAVAFRGVSTV